MKAKVVEFNVMPFDPYELCGLPPGISHILLRFYADPEATARIVRFFKENGFIMDADASPPPGPDPILTEGVPALPEKTP
jgi:hypothetical protein